MAEWSFRYKEKIAETTLASRCSKLLQYDFIEVEHILKFGSFYEDFDEELITQYVDCLKPENVRVILKSKSFQDSEQNLQELFTFDQTLMLCEFREM